MSSTTTNTISGKRSISGGDGGGGEQGMRSQ
jgi:hypothetical protein